MRVAVLHNAVAADAPPEDQDTLVQVEAVSAALSRLGHQPQPVPCTLDLAALRADLTRLGPDMVFNLVESLADADSLLYLPPAVLDALGLPYTGSRTEALFLTTHKLLAKQRMREAGLPTPAWMENNPCGTAALGCDRGLAQPRAAVPQWIIKGIWDQGSRGMEDDAVLDDVGPAELRRRLEGWWVQSGRPCFAEQFIEGREFNLAVLAGPAGPQSLPPAEIDFSAFPPGKPRIVGYAAKWRDDCFEFHHTTPRFDFAPSDGPLLERLQALALECWRLFGLRGWARVDFRVDAAGQPWILEVNANPCLSPDAGFAAAIARASISFEEAIRRILEDCRR